MERFDNVISVTAVSGDNKLGGADFDLAIAQGFCQACGIDFHKLPQSQQETLLWQTETCKIALTTQNSVIMAIESQELQASQIFTNEWLIRKCSGLFQRLLAPVRAVLRDAQTSAEGIGELVMVGGSSHMPSVRQYIAHMLQSSSGIRKHPQFISCPLSTPVSPTSPMRPRMRPLIPKRQ